MKYVIYEGYMEHLEKKLAFIQRKCKKLGCDFKYEKLGEEFHTVKDQNRQSHNVRFEVIDVEGVAKLNDWRFVATIQHTDSGNLIRKATDDEVPTRYYSCSPTCEHCNKIRSRKDTYLVKNDLTGEFKQVGNTCLKEFTDGISAEWASQLMELMEVFPEMSYSDSWSGSGLHFNTYYKLFDILCYTAEMMKFFGYVSSGNFDAQHTTKDRVRSYYEFFELDLPKYNQWVENDRPVDFAAYSDENKQLVETVLTWISNEDDTQSDYIHNLKVIASKEYIDHTMLGYAVSMIQAYNRAMDIQEKNKRREAASEVDKDSEFVGNVGDRLDLDVNRMELITTIDGMYGMTFLYKIYDFDGNVYTWFASSPVEDVEHVARIKATIKKHDEYRGVKQTVLTRCRVTLRTEDKDNNHEEGTFNADEVMKVFDQAV